MVRSFIKWNRKISARVRKFMDQNLGKIDGQEAYFYSIIYSPDIKKRSVLEIGGTQRPVFNKEDIPYYVGMDIDKTFDWENYYHQYLNQSCTEDYNLKSDLIFSKYLLEHVDNNERTFKLIFENLEPEGVSVHLFPLGYHPYSILTRMVGNKLQKRLISIVRPESRAVTGYPVYFDKCNSVSLNRFFKKHPAIKYQIKYFYGASEYFYFFFPFYLLVEGFNRISSLLGLSVFASNAVIVIRK